jgi:phosphopantetheinyl transferase
MIVTFFNIGLSVLSSKTPVNAGFKEELRAEGRRILSILDGRRHEDKDFEKEENGRPYFPDRHCDFNISHSGEIAAVAMVTGKGHRTGCDIELVRKRGHPVKVAQNFFSAEETEYVYGNQTRFFEIWTLKESYLKLKGRSVFDMADCPSFVRNNSLNNFVCDKKTALFLYEISDDTGKQYILSCAVEGPQYFLSAEEIKPDVKWFSETSLDCRCVAVLEGKPAS